MKRSKYTYALDIGNSALKLIKFRKSLKGLEIVDALKQPFGSEAALSNNDVEKIEIVQAALHTLCKGINDHLKKNILIALPADATIVRYITLPNIPRNKINKIIRFEAEQQIPILFSDVTWAYAVLPPSAKKDIDVVITAAKKTFVAAIREVIEQYNFHIESFEAGQVCLTNASNVLSIPHDGTIVVDMGAANVDVVLFYKGNCWGRTLRTGTAKMTQQIANAMHVDMAEAEKIKQKITHEEIFLKEDKLRPQQDAKQTASAQIIYDVLYEVLNEISRTVSYYLSIMRGATFTHIVVTGSGAYINNIAPFFAKNLGLKAADMTLRANVVIESPLRERFLNDFHYYIVTLGLACGYRNTRALRANMLGEEVRREREQKEQTSRLFFFFGISLLIMITVLFNFLYEYTTKQNIRKKLGMQLEAVIQKEERFEQVEERLKHKTAILTYVKNTLHKRTAMQRFLQDLEIILPENVWLDLIDYGYSAHRAIISGRTIGTLSDLNNITNALRELHYIKRVSFDSANIEEQTYLDTSLRIFSISVIFYEEEMN